MTTILPGETGSAAISRVNPKIRASRQARTPGRPCKSLKHSHIDTIHEQLMICDRELGRRGIDGLKVRKAYAKRSCPRSVVERSDIGLAWGCTTVGDDLVRNLAQDCVCTVPGLILLKGAARIFVEKIGQTRPHRRGHSTAQLDRETRN